MADHESSMTIITSVVVFMVYASVGWVLTYNLPCYYHEGNLSPNTPYVILLCLWFSKVTGGGGFIRVDHLKGLQEQAQAMLIAIAKSFFGTHPMCPVGLRPGHLPGPPACPRP
ncbi:hypothetical protein HDE_04046 [Halotydeus destructor]|nr:hypothetical protein HDE_04046 [Halotydeus destructor]